MTLNRLDGPNRYIKKIPSQNSTTHIQVHMGAFSRIDHMQGHKTSLNKYETIEIKSGIFSDKKI